MPSSTLQQLSDEIEAKGPSDFAKFFMYANLLQVITAKDEMTYKDVLPKTNNTFSSDKSLYLGELPADFYTRVGDYATTFENKSPDFMKVLIMFGATYRRTSQVADLAFILNKMQGYLEKPDFTVHSSTNQAIYQSLNFEVKRKKLLDEFIKPVVGLSKSALDGIDASVHGVLSLGVAMIGLYIMVHVSSALLALIGVGVLIGGAYGVYAGVVGAEKAYDALNPQAESPTDKRSKQAQQGAITKNEFFSKVIDFLDNETLYMQRTYYHCLFKPLVCTGITVSEQFNMDNSMADLTKKAREDIVNEERRMKIPAI